MMSILCPNPLQAIIALSILGVSSIAQVPPGGRRNVVNDGDTILYAAAYGMKCDSTTGTNGTDNAAPLQIAINAAQGAGATLLLPAGLCKFTRPPVISSRISILGTGTFLNSQGTTLFFDNVSAQACAITIAASISNKYATQGTQIGNFELSTNGSGANQDGICVFNTTAQFWNIHNIFFHNFTGWGLSWTGNTTYLQSTDISQLLFVNCGGGIGSDNDFFPRGTLVHFNQIDAENQFNNTSPKPYFYDLYGFGESQVDFLTAEGASYRGTAVLKVGGYNQMRVRNLHLELAPPYPTYSIDESNAGPPVTLVLEDAWGLQDNYPVHVDSTPITFTNCIFLFGVTPHLWSHQFSFSSGAVPNVTVDGQQVQLSPEEAGTIRYETDPLAPLDYDDGITLFEFSGGPYILGNNAASFATTAPVVPMTDSSDGRVFAITGIDQAPVYTLTITIPPALVGASITVGLRYFWSSASTSGVTSWQPLKVASGSNTYKSYLPLSTPVFNAWSYVYITLQNVGSGPIVLNDSSSGSAGGPITLMISDITVATGRKAPLLMGRVGPNEPIVTYGTAAPTSGTWVAGDIVQNSSPSPSGTGSWICTTSGTPGTWKPLTTVGM